MLLTISIKLLLIFISIPFVFSKRKKKFLSKLLIILFLGFKISRKGLSVYSIDNSMEIFSEELRDNSKGETKSKIEIFFLSKKLEIKKESVILFGLIVFEIGLVLFSLLIFSVVKLSLVSLLEIFLAIQIPKIIIINKIKIFARFFFLKSEKLKVF